MSHIDSIKKHKLSLKQKYRYYLAQGPEPKDKLSNPYNLFDDFNLADRAIINEVKVYLRRGRVTAQVVQRFRSLHNLYPHKR